MSEPDFNPLASSRRFRRPLPAPGSSFAGYTIEREIARGGAGAVFVARAVDGARYALKLFLGDMSQPVRRERFNREVTIGTSLHHAGIVRVLDHGEAQGRPYLVMELLENARPIDRFAEEEGLSLMARAQLLMEAAQTVHTAHKAEIVHRDLKPDNVLVTGDGQVKVVDFGIARQLDLQRLTQSGAVMGTLHYMAPEQVSGRTQAIAPHTDVYALGVIAYLLMSGEHPIEGDTGIEVMAAIAEGRFPRLSDVVPRAPAGISDVIQVAMATDPGQRYPHAGAMAQDLLAVCTETETAATARIVAPRHSARFPRRLAFALLVLVAGALWWRSQQAPDLKALREQAKTLRSEGRELLENPTQFLSDDAEAVLALAARADALLESAAPGTDRQALRDQLAPVLAVRGLLAVAQGDPQAAGRFVPPRPGTEPEVAALQAALANHRSEPAAPRELLRAIRRGLSRPDLHAWLVEALSRSGLNSERDAELAMLSLKQLERARAGALLAHERVARARAQHLLGDLAGAAATLAPLGDRAPPAVRWTITLDQAENVLANDEVDAALEALRDLPAGLDLPQRLTLNLRVQQLLSSGLEALVDGPKADPLQVRMGALIRLAVVLAPDAPLTHRLRDRLTDRAVSLDTNAGLIHIAAALSDAYPQDRDLQLRLASEGWRRQASAADERLALSALRRACAYSETQQQRGKFNTLLFKTLREATSDRGYAAEELTEALNAATIALESTEAPELRLDLLQGLADFHGDRQEFAECLAAANEALAIAPSDRQSVFNRILALRGLKRHDELPEAIGTYSTLARDTSSADDALTLAWSLYELGYAQETLDFMLPHMLAAPPNSSHLWWLRLATVRMRLGLREEAVAALLEAERKLSDPDRGPARRLMARIRENLKAGRAGHAELETLLSQLER